MTFHNIYRSFKSGTFASSPELSLGKMQESDLPASKLIDLVNFNREEKNGHLDKTATQMFAYSGEFDLPMHSQELRIEMHLFTNTGFAGICPRACRDVTQIKWQCS